MSRRRQGVPCLKQRHGTPELAQEALERVWDAADVDPTRRRAVRHYRCPDCHGYHLTSRQMTEAWARG